LFSNNHKKIILARIFFSFQIILFEGQQSPRVNLLCIDSTRVLLFFEIILEFNDIFLELSIDIDVYTHAPINVEIDKVTTAC